MTKKAHHAHRNLREEQARKESYPVLLEQCKQRGLRTLEDFSPAELTRIRARLDARLAVAYVSSTGDVDGD